MIRHKRTTLDIFTDLYYKRISIEQFLDETKEQRKVLSLSDFYSKIALYKLLLDIDSGVK